MIKSRSVRNVITITVHVILVCAFLLNSGLSRASSIRESETSSAMLSHQQSGKKYLLSVGINEYSQSPLNGCVNDAVSIMELLTGGFGFDREQSRLLKDREATRANILQQIERYIRLTSKGDLFVFFFSGHGTLFPDNRSLVRDETEILNLQFLREGPSKSQLPDGLYDSALVPIDALAGGAERPWRNFILDDELFELFSRMTSKGVHVILISDSCHSGTLARSLDLEGTPKMIDPESALGLKISEIPIPASLEKIDARQMGGLYLGLTSSQDNQSSLDSPQLKRGYFTYALTQSILELSPAERKRLTYRRLYDICRIWVERVTKHSQTPKLDDRYFSGSLDEPVFLTSTISPQPVATQPMPQPVPTHSSIKRVQIHLIVRGRRGEAIPDSSLALFRPEIQSVPAKGQITPDQTLLILRTQPSGEAIGESTMSLPGDYWIKVVAVGYRTRIEKVRLEEDPQRHGYVRLSAVLDPE